MLTREAEAAIADLAARQHGLVTRRQLFGAGLTPAMVKGRVAAGRLRPVHRGVYLIGPLVTPYTREMAAALASGPRAFVSHRSAAPLWQLLPRRPDAARVEVSVEERDVGRRPGIRSHRVRPFEPDEVTAVDGIPVTSPERTLLDLASVIGARDLEQALARAERHELTSTDKLLSLVNRHRRRRGIRVLRALLESDAQPSLTRSEAEERFLALIRKAGLPRPQTNVYVGGHEVDFFWPDQRIIVEIDGFAFHSSQKKFENDRRRDAELAALGFQVIRVTWWQLVKEPEATLVRVAQALAARQSARAEASPVIEGPRRPIPRGRRHSSG
jgi:very-short-patch-repair endonuclease/predicted transcriptional regulator of viral defense system